jgi:hypothetical protein
MTEKRFRLPGSSRPMKAAIEPMDLSKPLTVTVYVRSDPHDECPPAALEQARLAPSMRS